MPNPYQDLENEAFVTELIKQLTGAPAGLAIAPRARVILVAAGFLSETSTSFRVER